MSTKCCHCGKTFEVPEQLEANVRNYGPSSFNVQCTNKKCNRIVLVRASRIVKVCKETTPAYDESYTSW